MSWSLFLTRTVSTTKLVKVPTDEVILALHQPPTIVRLNPLVIDCSPDPNDPTLFVVTDNLKVLGVFPTTIKYTVKFSFVEDGFDSVVNAGGGTLLTNKWRATAVQDGTEIHEAVIVQAFFLFLPLVMKSLKTSHVALLDNLASKLEGEEAPQSHSRYRIHSFHPY
ncbi:hypothetical protein JAAARDRAFT_53877 [Jaapia argillacea MUCL 33604]|uniref:DUF7053 domain-containing protein n=1 Tax=Jaapia argillacea MUCL 33604 TaxID=933084 RepID=A0A067Q9F9_9AGAM|nr:hypothetical protein JAAARDRAFT_53877 [Jaapia argillacea MUCL 33604]